MTVHYAVDLDGSPDVIGIEREFGKVQTLPSDLLP